MTLQIVFAIAGCIALLIAAFGGGLTADKWVIPKISSSTRFILSGIGVFLAGAGIVLTFYPTPQSFKDIFMPESTSTLIPITMTPIASNGTASSTKTPAPTYSPTFTYTPYVPGCFGSAIWSPYEPDQTMSPSNGCWDLSSWGLRGDSNPISINLPFSNIKRSHGIYQPIQTDSEISFKITMSEPNLVLGLSSYVAVGIINMNPLGPANSRLIYYHYTSPDNYILPQVGMDGKYILNLSPLDFSTPQSVDFNMAGHQVDISVNGKLIQTMNVLFDQRAFWISYSIPEGSQMTATISDLEIH